MPPANTSLSPTFYLLLVGALARLVLIFIEPYTSNDVARYLFDGRIALEGYDPYQMPHNAHELDSLRQQWMPPAEHVQYATLYPPLALSLFSFASSFGPQTALWVWKALTLSASLTVLLLAYKVLQRAGRLQHLPLVALSPLLILEAGEGLHLDIITALAVLSAIYFWQAKRLSLVGSCIAIGGLLKILPMVLLLPLFIVLNRWQDRVSLVATAFIVWALGYSVGFFLGFRPIGSIAVFFEKWRSGSAFFLWLEPHFSAANMLLIALSVLLIGFACLASYLWKDKFRSVKNNLETLDSKLFLSMQLAMALPLMVSPVVFPWYLLPLVALNALRPNLLVISWTLTIPLLYEVLNQFVCCGDWKPAVWPIHMIGITLIVSVAISLRLMRIQNRV